MSVARYSAYVFGAAAGGALVATVGSGWAIALDAATFAVSVVLLVRIRIPSSATTMQAPHFVRELADGWHAFTENLWVWLITAWISLYFLISYAPFFVLGPYVAKRSMHGAAGWAIVLTGEAFGALAGAIAGGGPVAPAAGHDRPRLRGLGRAARSSRGAGAAGGDRGCSGSCRVRVLVGSVVWETELQRTIAPSKLSRVSAYNWVGAMAFLPAGYAIACPPRIADRGVDLTVGRSCLAAGLDGVRLQRPRRAALRLGHAGAQLRRPRQVGELAVETDVEIAAREADLHVACTQRGGDRDRARPRRPGLPDTALPDARLDRSGVDAPRNLDVRAVGKARMGLEQPARCRQLRRIAVDHGVRIADVDGRETHALDLVRFADDHGQPLLDQAAGAASRAAPRRSPDANRDGVGAGLLASHRAAMRVPLPDISAREPSGFQITISSQSGPRPFTSRMPSASPTSLADAVGA